MKILASLLVSILLLASNAQAWQLVGSGVSSGGGGGMYGGATSNTGTSTTPTTNTPSGTTDGDLLVMFVNDDTGGGTTATGWTELQYVDSYSSADAVAYYKIASSEGATQTATLATSADWQIFVIRLTKTSGTWNIDGSAQSNVAVPYPAAITVGDPGMFLFFWGSDDGVTVTTPPADLTEIGILSTASGRAGAWYLATTGSTRKSITLSSGENAAIAIGVSITP